MTILTPDLAAIAEQEMPCTCAPDYKRLGTVDPACRHDDRDRAIAAAVEAERESIALLAERHGATYWDEDHPDLRPPFADLIRGEQR